MSNPGALRGLVDFKGTYNSIPRGGSWAGNRGRLSVDEHRAWGYPDGSNSDSGGARIVNTNPLQGAKSLAFPGDVGSIYNALSGFIMLNGAATPFNAVYNSAGTIRHSTTSNATSSVFENNTVVDNVPGTAVSLMGLQSMVGVTTYFANGAACTIANGTFTDCSMASAFITAAGGTISTTNYYNYTASLDAFTAGTITNYTAYKVIFPTVTSGVITNYYAISMPIPTTGVTKSVGIRIGEGEHATSLTAITAQPGVSIDAWPGTTWANYAFSIIPAILNNGGTIVIRQSAALGLLQNFISNGATYKNGSADAVNLASVSTVNHAPIFQADTQTIIFGGAGGLTSGFLATPTFNVTGGGALTCGANRNYQSTGVVSTGATVTLFQHFNVTDITGAGTTTTQVGLDIPALVGSTGTTTVNIGIRNASSLRQQGAFIATNNVVSVAANAGTVSSAAYMSTFTNSSAATMTVTMAIATPTPIDGQTAIVRIYDFSGVAQTITWVNTENGGATAPVLSNGSTTLPKTTTFMWNAGTSKWRCIAAA